MKTEDIRRFYRDRLAEPLGQKRARATLILCLVVFILSLALIPALLFSEASRREQSLLRSKQKDFAREAADYGALKAAVDRFEQRPPVPTAAAAQTVSELLNVPGAGARTKAIKGMSTKEAGEQLKEESMEVQIERLSLNEFINVCYRVEQAPFRIVLKRASVKKSFENPDLLDATLVLSLFTKPGGR